MWWPSARSDSAPLTVGLWSSSYGLSPRLCPQDEENEPPDRAYDQPEHELVGSGTTGHACDQPPRALELLCRHPEGGARVEQSFSLKIIRMGAQLPCTMVY